MMMIMIWTPLPLSSLARPLLGKFLDPYIRALSMQYPGYSSMMWAAIAYIVLVKQQPATQLSLLFSLKCHSNSIPINDATCQLSWYFQASGKPCRWLPVSYRLFFYAKGLQGYLDPETVGLTHWKWHFRALRKRSYTSTSYTGQLSLATLDR